MSDPLDDLHPLDPEDHEQQLEGVLELVASTSRVVDLGAGIGRVARPLAARSGCRLLAVDEDSEVLGRPEWKDAAGVELLVEDLLDQEATWHHRGPFELALCLGNTLALFNHHQLISDLFERLATALSPGGRFLIDDFPVWGWDAVHAGEWPSGLSEDGSAQIVWVPGEPVFAFRTGDAVDPNADSPAPGERLLRLWSLSELEYFARKAGLRGPDHHPDHHLLAFELL
ncbi:MAG: class I SAM-dependent methyltransferase [Phycisphaerales bacterium]|nr:class I SAM-dependent methyltransferase [Phycisphaerales bacterium]